MFNGTRRDITEGGMDQRPTLGALVSDITNELRSIMRGEVDLAKAEIKNSARSGAKGGAMLAIAAALLVMVGFMFTWAAVYGLSETGLPLWACFLIVGAIYLVVAAVIALLGIRSLKKAKGPEQAVAEMQVTKEIVASIPPNTPPAVAVVDKGAGVRASSAT